MGPAAAAAVRRKLREAAPAGARARGVYIRGAARGLAAARARAHAAEFWRRRGRRGGPQPARGAERRLAGGGGGGARRGRSRAAPRGDRLRVRRRDDRDRAQVAHDAVQHHPRPARAGRAPAARCAGHLLRRRAVGRRRRRRRARRRPRRRRRPELARAPPRRGPRDVEVGGVANRERAALSADARWSRRGFGRLPLAAASSTSRRSRARRAAARASSASAARGCRSSSTCRRRWRGARACSTRSTSTPSSGC